MGRIPERNARQTPNAKTQRDTEICKDGANAVARSVDSARVCKLCGSPDCPGAKTANVRQAIRRGKALDVPPYGFAEAWCHDGGRMLVAGNNEENQVVHNIMWWRSGGASWRRLHTPTADRHPLGAKPPRQSIVAIRSLHSDLCAVLSRHENRTPQALDKFRQDEGVI